jgi:eukaryotic-like serine/threonine-protein kinase
MVAPWIGGAGSSTPPPSTMAPSQAAAVTPTTVLPITEASGATPTTLTGVLQLQVLPWAEVTVDGKNVGMTPIKPITLTAGVHNVRASNPNFPPVQRSVVVKAGETTRLELDLKAETPSK